MHHFPSIDTKLKCPYYIIIGSPHKEVKCPWITSQTLPPTIAATPSDSAEQLYNPPVSKRDYTFINVYVNKYRNYL